MPTIVPNHEQQVVSVNDRHKPDHLCNSPTIDENILDLVSEVVAHPCDAKSFIMGNRYLKMAEGLCLYRSRLSESYCATEQTVYCTCEYS